MLSKILESVGKIDADVRMMLIRVVMAATKSGDANGFLRRHLGRILQEVEQAERPEPQRATTTHVGAPSGHLRDARPRK